MSRISIEVSPDQHQVIKSMATLQGKTIRDYMLGLVFNEEHIKTPNKETIAAIEEARADGGTEYASVKAMMADILGQEK